MRQGRRRPVAATAGAAFGASALVAVGLALALGVGRGDGNQHDLHELVGEGDISTADVTLDEYAEVVRIVARGDIPDADKRRVASALSLYLDDIGETAVRQSEGAEDDDFARPDMVAFFEELGHDEEAANAVAEGLVAWVTQVAEPFVTDPAADQDPDRLALDAVAVVMGAAEDGLDAADGAPIDGNDFERLVIEQLREDLAKAAAAEDDRPSPRPGEYSATLAELRPTVGAALDDLDVAASNERRDDEDTPW
jgi:hypothetical protein